MSGRFITDADIVRDSWTGAHRLGQPAVVHRLDLDVRHGRHLEPGGGHPFHRHPDQEEIIWVREGRIEQWLEKDKHELGPGEAVYIPKDIVHASFTVGDEPAKLSVILTPTAGDDGYSVIDVFEEEPWASLR